MITIVALAGHMKTKVDLCRSEDFFRSIHIQGTKLRHYYKSRS
jgi:hypothetical protein